MNDPRRSQPNWDENGNELCQPDGGGGLENVEILEDVRHRHESERPEESEADPGAIQVDGHERRRDGEVVHEGVQLKHEPEFVTGRDELQGVCYVN